MKRVPDPVVNHHVPQKMALRGNSLRHTGHSFGKLIQPLQSPYFLVSQFLVVNHLWQNPHDLNDLKFQVEWFRFQQHEAILYLAVIGTIDVLFPLLD